MKNKNHRLANYHHTNGSIKNENHSLLSSSDLLELTTVAVSQRNCFPMMPVAEMSVTLVAAMNSIDIGLESDELTEQLESAKKLRELLSTDRDTVLRQVIDRDWTPQLIAWLGKHEQPVLQIEALWALTNIAAGANDNTAILLHHGVIPALVSLLGSKNEEVLAQAVWVLGNLAGEGFGTRDLVLSAGALPLLMKQLRNKNAKISLLRIISWTISNLCDGQPRPIFNIHSVLTDLAQMLKHNDTEILSHISWSLSHLCDGPCTHIQAVVNSEACAMLVQLLSNGSWRVTKPALRAIGNIVCAEDDHDYTQHIIECGAVPLLRQLINHSNRDIQKEACWTLSNIAAGTVEQIQYVLDSDGIPALITLAENQNTDPEVKSEACWVVLNATSCGSDSQIEYLVRKGCISVIKELLHETTMIMMALEGLERILQVGEQVSRRTSGPNPYIIAMSSINFKELSEHKLPAVSKKCFRLWHDHFVECAICHEDYSKHSNDTHFCDECKCNVCKNCNCTVFHLEYQESLWLEESAKESSEKKAKQASKRSKRQKKRLRTKERKAANKQGSNISDPNSKDGHSSESDAFEEDEKIASPPQAEPKSLQKSRNRTRSTNRKQLDESMSELSISNVKDADRNNPDNIVTCNDDLVSLLNQTGSIMALATFLDEEDRKELTENE